MKTTLGISLWCLTSAIATGVIVFSLFSPPEISAAPPANPAPMVSPTNSTPVAVSPSKMPVIKRQITGAELYSINCNRCHPERYPTERTAAQWKTIMLHMQVRANLPVSQAKLILKYLQDNSGR